MQYDLSKITEKYGIVSVTPLLKGWSRDKKYVLTNAKEQKFLLRVSDVSLFEKKKKQFELLNRIGELNLECSRPIDFGYLNENTIYTLLSWIPGQSAEDTICNYSNKNAYEMGIEAGIALKKLHQIPFEPQEQTWFERYEIKAERKINALKNCEYKLDNQEFLLSYFKNNVNLMKNRPLSFCHGDYHLGNMIINNGKIGIIDFDKNNVADYLDDFKPYHWNVFKSEYFETGLIDGYFNGKIPDDFFQLLKFYTVESCISHLPWAVQFGKEEIETTYKVVNACNLWWDNYKIDIPTWYKKI